MALVERLEFDISSASDAIDKLDRSLSEATQSFKVNLADALDVLNGVQVQIPAPDATAITAAIDDAVVAADTNVQLEFPFDESQITGPIDAAVAAADSTVVITADTSEAVSAVDDLAGQVDAASASISAAGDSAGHAGDSFGGLGRSFELIGAGAGIAEGSARELTGVIGGLGPAGVIAAAGATTLSAAIGDLFKHGVEATSAEQRFNLVLGDTAEQFKQINIAGFQDDLSHLGTEFGSTTSQIENTSASLVQFAENNNATTAQAELFAQEILTLAARAESLKPALGDVADIADRLSTSIVRSRSAVQFGIQLSTADIQLRAFADTGKTAASSLTIYEKAAAAAELATEKYGKTIKTDIEQGSQNAAIQLRSLGARLEDAVHEIAKPLVAPVFQLLNDSLPIAVQVAEALGNLGTHALPVVEAGFKDVAPAIGLATNALEAATPALDLLATVLNALPPEAVTAELAIFALGKVLTGLASTAALSGLAVSTSVTEMASSFTLLNPVTIAAAIGIAAIANAWSDSGAHAEKLKQETDDLTSALKDQDGQVRITTDALTKFVETQTNLGKDHGEVKLLSLINVTTKDLGEFAQTGAQGMTELISRLIQAGQISPVLEQVSNGFRLANGQIKFSNDILEINGQKFGQVDGNVKKLLNDFLDLQTATQALAKGTLESAVSQGNLTSDQEKAAEATHHLADGTVDYVGVLQDLQPLITAHTDIEKRHQTELAKSADATIATAIAFAQYQDALTLVNSKAPALAEAFTSVARHLRDPIGSLIDLATQIGATGVSAEDLKIIAKGLGIGASDLDAFVKTVTQDITSLTDSAVKSLPTVSGLVDQLIQTASSNTQQADSLNKQADQAAQSAADAAVAVEGETAAQTQKRLETVAKFTEQVQALRSQADALKTVFDPADIEKAVDAQIQSVTKFQNVLDFLVTNNLPELARLAAEKGPDFAEALITKIQADQNFAPTLEKKLEQSDDVFARFKQHLETDIAPKIIAEFAIIGAQSGQRLGDNLHIDLSKLTSDLSTEAPLISDSLIDGIISRINQRRKDAEEAARALGNAIAIATRQSLGSRSPSTVFMKIGNDLMDGFELGIQQQARAVVAQAEKVAKDAAEAASKQQITVKTAVAPVIAPVSAVSGAAASSAAGTPIGAGVAAVPIAAAPVTQNIFTLDPIEAAAESFRKLQSLRVGLTRR